MKKYIAGFLLCSLIIPFGIKVSTYIDYAIRYDYYVNVLCENKDNSEMKCNGTCQLSEVNSDSNDNSQKPTIPNSSKIEISFFIPSNQISLDIISDLSNSAISFAELNLNKSSLYQEVPTLPPQV